MKFDHFNSFLLLMLFALQQQVSAINVSTLCSCSDAEKLECLIKAAIIETIYLRIH